MRSACARRTLQLRELRVTSAVRAADIQDGVDVRMPGDLLDERGSVGRLETMVITRVLI